MNGPAAVPGRARRQKRAVSLLIAAFLLGGAASFLIQRGIEDVVRFTLQCALCFAVYRGRRWARWILGGLMAVSAMVLSVYVSETVPAAMRMPALIYALLGIYAVGAIVLLNPMLLRQHFRPDSG